MEDKINTTETKERTVSKTAEVKSTPSIPPYNPDDYIEEEFMYDDMWYYSEECFSCKHWLGNDCGAPTGPCSYESF